MIKFRMKLDRGNKVTKVVFCACVMCDKEVPAEKNMWEVTKFSIEDGPGDERERYITNDYFCSKECANLFILREL